MLEKKIGVVVGILMLTILFAGIVSADSCSITSRTSCTGSNKIVMGLSSATNAHGEKTGTYPSVLCCDFGTGATTCDTTNKILGLSSSTNAHAEKPDPVSPQYTTNVCYEDLRCISTSGLCSATPYPIGMISLSGSYASSGINSHIGAIGYYSTNICCKRAGAVVGVCGDGVINTGETCDDGDTSSGDGCSSSCIIEGGWTCVGEPSVCTPTTTGCDLTSALWGRTTAIAGTEVSLIVQGTGECQGQTLSFEVWEDDLVGDDPVTTNPANVIFGNPGTWTAEWQDDGILDPDPEYYFIASVGDESITSSNQLKVSQAEEDYCILNAIQSCNNYPDEEYCESDYCEVNGESAPDSIDCSDANTDCYCEWINDACSFGWTISPDESVCGNGIEETGEECDDGNLVNGDGCSSTCKYEILPPRCPEGTTLCADGTCSLNCDDTDEGTICNYDYACNDNEGCACRDCDDQVDQCVIGLLCSIEDVACCTDVSDGVCNPYCSYTDPDCGPGVCGNGIEETGEECDDGNLVNGDGCSSTCKYEILPPRCPEGTTLCADGTCSLNCDDTDEGTICNYDDTCNDNEGCACRDCDDQVDQCVIGLLCSIEDTACCNDVSDGVCNPYCSYTDPDCVFPGICGNNLIDAGETCDGNGLNKDWGPINPITGCDRFDTFTGGTLSCYAPGTANECHFNTESCEGGTPGGICGDNVANPGEECDGAVPSLISWGSITGCVDFDDFIDGDLSCDASCMFDTSDCGKDGDGGIGAGLCSSVGNPDEDNCDSTGFIIRSWTATIIWPDNNIGWDTQVGCELAVGGSCVLFNRIGDDGKWHYDPNNWYANCESVTEVVDCAAQLRLPFFGFYNIVITSILMILIYAFLIRRTKR